MITGLAVWLILPQGIQEIFATDSQSSLLVLVHNLHLFFQMYALPPPKKNKDGHNAKLETSYVCVGDVTVAAAIF